MLLSYRTLLLPALAAFALLAGCAPNHTAEITCKGSARAGVLGRTMVVCRVQLPPAAPAAAEKTTRIATLVNRTVASTAGLDPMDGESLVAHLKGCDPFGASDAELAAAARKAGADSVVLLLVTGYGGELVVSALPPYWRVNASFTYRARVIDAAGVSLYLDTWRTREQTRLLGVLRATDLDRDFAADLAAVLRDTGPANAAGPERS